jgi:hypothetical protein
VFAKDDTEGRSPWGGIKYKISETTIGPCTRLAVWASVTTQTDRRRTGRRYQLLQKRLQQPQLINPVGDRLKSGKGEEEEEEEEEESKYSHCRVQCR